MSESALVRGSHSPLQWSARLLRAALWAREQSPRRSDAEASLLYGARPGACPQSLTPLRVSRPGGVPVEILQGLFDRYDADASGSLTYTQFARGLYADEAQALQLLN